MHRYSVKPLQHHSAKPSHYDKEAESYDTFNEKNAEQINQQIEDVIYTHKVKTVLDLTCGTGSQVFWLARQGYEVIGADINLKMLEIAWDKAKQEKLNLKFIQGDMRTIKVGEFDAVLTKFNAIGHLTKAGKLHERRCAISLEIELSSVKNISTLFLIFSLPMFFVLPFFIWLKNNNTPFLHFFRPFRSKTIAFAFFLRRNIAFPSTIPTR